MNNLVYAVLLCACSVCFSGCDAGKRLNNRIAEETIIALQIASLAAVYKEDTGRSPQSIEDLQQYAGSEPFPESIGRLNFAFELESPSNKLTMIGKTGVFIWSTTDRKLEFSPFN